MYINGLPISSLFCYTALLCLHQCLLARIFLSFLIFCSVSACTPRLSLPLLDMHFYSISFFCALCSVYYFYSIRYISSVRFSCNTQHSSARMNNSQQQQPSLLCFAFIYHAKSSARSYTQLIIFFGGYPESVHHQRLILRFFAFSGSATLHLLYHS
jgi:hypothetical protein